MFIVAVIAALVFGFSTGLVAFRVKSRWCPTCGATTLALQSRHQHTAARPR